MKLIAAIAPLLCLAPLAGSQENPPADPKDKTVDVAQTAERIVRAARDAGKRLGEKDPGEATRDIQAQILKDIDELIRKAKEPPQNQPMGGGNAGGGMSNSTGGMSRQPMTGQGQNGPLSRQERRERARQNAKNDGGLARQPQPMFDPLRPENNFGGGLPDKTANRVDSKDAPPRIPDVYKEVWGHLPEKMRQEMDLYFRDRFMPRYSELLRQYYSSLAERAGKHGP